MSIEMIEEVQSAFARAAALADRAGFDVLEIHGAHGYLIHSFLSPIANHRNDAYGGDLQRRLRFALETAERVRAHWPAGKPLFFRVSVIDGVEEGWSMADTLALVAELKVRGVDVIDTSSGGIEGKSSNTSRIARTPGYHVPFATDIRRTTGIITQTVGLIRSAYHAEEILQTGGADLIAIGREALYDPFWALHAAAELGCDPDFSNWPQQYGWWLQIRSRFTQVTDDLVLQEGTRSSTRER
jgi:2,4-dienoyl-CoA reductase-like NADH-dependent reductase (Old Yellow Enzyme family)